MNRARSSVRSWVGAAACMLAMFSMGAQAQETRVQELERNLRERDKVISELLDRVTALERRVGVRRHPREVTGAQQEAVASTAERRAGDPVVRPPGAVVVEEGEAERALERSLTREGALLLPAGVLEIEPSLSYARREEGAPRFVTSDGRVLAASAKRNTNSVTGDVALRLGLPHDAQLEIGLPYRWREVQSVTAVGFTPTDASSESGSGVGDLRIGLAKTLLREGLWRPDLVGRVTWDTDSGRRQRNGLFLGGGFHELRGSLSAIKRQDPVAFVGGLSYQHAFESDGIRPGPTLGANLGSFVALSPETSLRLLLSGAYQKETQAFGRKIAGSSQTLGTFVVGGSTLLARGTLLNLSLGIGLTEDAEDLSLTVSLPIRFR